MNQKTENILITLIIFFLIFPIVFIIYFEIKERDDLVNMRDYYEDYHEDYYEFIYPDKQDSEIFQEFDQEINIEKFFDKPYPISWIDWNRAKVYLTGVTLSKDSKTTNLLSLYFNIELANGGFCSEHLNHLKLSIPEEELYSAIETSQDCASGYESLLNQKVVFSVPSDVKKFTIKGLTFGGLSYQGNTSKFIDFFEIIINKDNIKVNPLMG